jgi:hypothetical protein
VPFFFAQLQLDLSPQPEQFFMHLDKFYQTFKKFQPASSFRVKSYLKFYDFISKDPLPMTYGVTIFKILAVKKSIYYIRNPN